jgi:hypothetical protein
MAKEPAVETMIRMRERVKLDEAAGLRGESIERRGLGGGAGQTVRSVQWASSVDEYGGNGSQQECRYDINRRYLCGPDRSDRAVAGEHALYKRKGRSQQWSS